MYPAAGCQQKRGHRRARRNDQKDHQNSADAFAEATAAFFIREKFLPLLPRRDAQQTPQNSLKKADQRTDSLHRMPEPVRIADQKIHCRRDEKHDYSVLHRRQQESHFYL